MGAITTQNVVGTFIREKREAAKLSQRSLGQLFDPPVTTQFISNIERGVSPLPPVHVATLVRALKIQESELLQALEQEYAVKISSRLGRTDAPLPGSVAHLSVPVDGAEYFRRLSEAFAKADVEQRNKIRQAIQQILDSLAR